jgi:hypothetical protein
VPSTQADCVRALAFDLVPAHQRQAGVAVESTEVPGADHLWMGAPDPEAIFAAAVDFARRVARGPP